MEYDSEILHKDEVKPIRKPSLRELRLISARFQERIRYEKAIQREQARINKLAGKLFDLKHGR